MMDCEGAAECAPPGLGPSGAALVAIWKRLQRHWSAATHSQESIDSYCNSLMAEPRALASAPAPSLSLDGRAQKRAAGIKGINFAPFQLPPLSLRPCRWAPNAKLGTRRNLDCCPRLDMYFAPHPHPNRTRTRTKARMRMRTGAQRISRRKSIACVTGSAAALPPFSRPVTRLCLPMKWSAQLGAPFSSARRLGAKSAGWLRMRSGGAHSFGLRAPALWSLLVA